MLPVVVSISLLGTRPWSATGGFQFRIALTAPGSCSEPISLTAALVRSPLTCAGVQCGWTWSRSAASPAIIGAAIDVPLVWMYWPPAIRQLQLALAKTLFGASTETMWAPGAYTSGFETPSWVVPRLDHEAAASSLGSAVPFSSTPPTVITYGSFAGEYCTASRAVPRLPAAATTTMPCIQA